MVSRHKAILSVFAVAGLLFLILFFLVAAAAAGRLLTSEESAENERLDSHVGPSWRGNPHVAVDAQGRVYAFWDDYRLWPQRSIYWNIRDGSWDTEALYLAGTNVKTGPVAVNAGGELYFTYRDGNGTPRFRKRRGSGVWDAAEGIPNGRLPGDIVVTDAGQVHLLFGPDTGGEVYALARAAGGTWGVEERVNRDVTALLGVPARLAMDAAGSLYALWGYRDGTGGEHLYLSQAASEGVWDAPRLVASLPGGHELVGVDLDAGAQDIHILWTSCTDEDDCQLVYSRCSDGSCAASQTVVSNSGDSRYGPPRIVVDGEEVVYSLFWGYSTGDDSSRLYLIRRLANGVWSDPVELDAGAGGDSQPELAAGGGDISAVWNRWLSTDDGHAVWGHTWQAGFLPGQVADLTLDSEDIQFGQLYRSAGRFFLPLKVSVHNEGTGAVYDAVVRFLHGPSNRPALIIVDSSGIAVTAGGSADVTYDWDVTEVMGRLDLTVVLDPDDEIIETNDNNNRATATTVADANPRITMIRSGFRPGKFLSGVPLDNRFRVKVDWNGDLPGLGAPGFVTFELNGSRSDVPISDPDGWAEQTYDMGLLNAGSNLLRLTATSAGGRISPVEIIELMGVAAPAWLTGNAVVYPEPPGALYDKDAVYRVETTWPASPLDGTIDVPALSGPLMPGRFGPVLQPWSLQLEFRSGGRLGGLTGRGELQGYLADRLLIGADSGELTSSGQLDIVGNVELSQSMSQLPARAPGMMTPAGSTITLRALTGTLQTTGVQQTSRLPFIDPGLPIFTQSALSLDVDANLEVMEREDGQLDWLTQTLRLNADIEGILPDSAEGVTHLEGGIGGQPWHELELAPGGVYTRSYAADLFAWAKERFFVWDKTWTITYSHSLSHQPVTVRRTGPTLSAYRSFDEQAQAADGLPTGVYAFAEPALSYGADDDMTLVHVRRSGISGLNLSAHRWDGVDWTETDLVTLGGDINAQPTVAYAGQTPVLLWTRVTTPVTDLDLNLRAMLTRGEIVSALYVGGVAQPPTAAFHSSGPAPSGQEIQFYNDTAAGVPPETNYVWDFGDGTGHSTLVSPTNEYTAVGTYTVTLTATNAIGSDVFTDTVEITGAVLTQRAPAASPPQVSYASAEPADRLATGDWLTWTLITSNTVMDFSPVAQANAAGSQDVLAMWLRSDDANYPLFVDETTRTLTVTVMAARWDGVTWSTPTMVMDDVSSRHAPQFAYWGDSVALAWSHDRDANPATITDTEIHVAAWVSPTNWMTPSDWNPPDTEGVYDDGGDAGDLTPRVVFDALGRATVVWTRVTPGGADQLWYAVYSGSTWAGPFSAAFEVQGIDGLQLVATPDGALIALWRGRSESGPDLWYSVFDREFDSWSLPRQLTNDPTVEGDYSAVVNSVGQAVVVYTGRQLVSGEGRVADQLVEYPTLEEIADLFQATSEPATARDLTVTDLTVTPANPSGGSSALVSGTIVNNGSLTVDPAYLVFRDDGDDISVIYDVGPLAAGKDKTYAFNWDVADTGAAHVLHLIADPENVIAEANEANNVITLTTALPDLYVAWRATGFSTDTITVTVGISNSGAIVAPAPFDVELRAGSETGASYAVARVDEDLAAGDEIGVQFVLDDLSAVPSSAVTSFAVVDVDDAVTEADEGNNAGLLDVPRRPDLTLGPYDLTGAPTQLLSVRNQGPVATGEFLVAIYEGAADGSLLLDAQIPNLSPGDVAEVPFSGAPGEANLVVRLDPDDRLVEGDESNNLAERAVTLWHTAFLPLMYGGP